MTVKSILGTVGIYIILGLSNSALAIPVGFDLVHDGTSTSLATGSADPHQYALNVGDQLTYTVNAANNDYWLVDTNFNFIGALFMLDGGTRNGNWGIDFSLDGATVAGSSINGLISSSVHIGEQIGLTAGLMFDEIVLTYDFLSSTATTDIIQTRDFLSPISSYQDSGNLTYMSASVPEPSIIWLLGSGILLLGFARRKA